jgi:hypothetical protein
VGTATTGAGKLGNVAGQELNGDELLSRLSQQASEAQQPRFASASDNLSPSVAAHLDTGSPQHPQPSQVCDARGIV